jgi:hypothetical protein
MGLGQLTRYAILECGPASPGELITEFKFKSEALARVGPRHRPVRVSRADRVRVRNGFKSRAGAES